MLRVRKLLAGDSPNKALSLLILGLMPGGLTSFLKGKEWEYPMVTYDLLVTLVVKSVLEIPRSDHTGGGGEGLWGRGIRRRYGEGSQKKFLEDYVFKAPFENKQKRPY
jgi:hypothetical protein